MAKKKLSAKELMDSVVDLELLEKRRLKKKEKIEEIKEDKIIELKWFQKPMDINKFSIIEKDNKFYIHYSDWSEKIHIGPYDTIDDVNSIIDMYIKETKKSNILKRKFKTNNIHSVLF